MENDVKLNDEIVELNVTRETLSSEDILGGIIIPNTDRNALTKTTVCTIKDVNENTSKKYNISIGDEVLVDRFAIISYNKMKDLSKPYRGFIRVENILLKKKK